MAVYMQIDRLTKSVGDRMLFEDVSFAINEGDKIGVIARNGTGKTTLLRIIAGLDTPDSGTVTPRSGLRVGILEQTPTFPAGLTVIEACLQAGTEGADAVIEYELALASGDTAQLEKAMHTMDARHAWDFEDRVSRMLTQLGITDLKAKVDHLSGGQLKRVALARLLLSDPDLLILDEPTNHLDIDVIEWLETYLTRSRLTLLMVTHDRYFLDRIVDVIIEMDRRHIYTVRGRYEDYLRRRAERIEALTGELAKARNTLRRETEWMRRQPQARAGKARYRIDSYHELRQKAAADATDLAADRNVRLDVRSSYIGSKIFVARNISKRYGDKVILNDFSYTFARYERVGIVGPNGAGKTTLISILQGLIAPDSGSVDVGETVRFGYYTQHGITFDPQKRVIDAVTEYCEDVVVNDGLHFSPMQYLQRFLFTPADQQKYIHTLSGGERARLHLATVLMRSPNFLILDEPTNDLDIVTLGLLEDYLRDFKGCLIVVSHDRFFLDSIVDHLFVLRGDGTVRDYPGGYSDYRAALAAEQAEAKELEKPAKTEKPASQSKPRPEKLTFKERKELEELTAEIEALEAEKADLDARFASPCATDDLPALSKRYAEIGDRLDTITDRWLILSEKS